MPESETTRPKVIAIMGPTAAGKTQLALDLAAHFDTEIVSVDSALIYRGMDIGTAKPSATERAAIPHHLIDIRDPAEAYSVAEFCREATVIIESLVAKGKIPILVGGTMLYFKALLEGLSELPQADPALRASLEARADRDGWPTLHDELRGVDPQTAKQIHPNHSQRIARALEVFYVTGKPMSVWRQERQGGLLDLYDWQQIAVVPRQRKILHDRIALRFEQMLEHGFIGEVERLYQRDDLHDNLPSVRAVGYRQCWHYLQGKLGYAEMKEVGIAATRQLAKRQLTWLRSWHGCEWLYTQDAAGQMRKPGEIVNESLNFFAKRTI